MTDAAAQETAGLEGLVQRAATGDEVAFARLVSVHHASMARVAFVISGDSVIASDAVQLAWTIAWRRLGDVRDPAQVGSWLISVAANETRQLVRRQRRRPVVDLSSALETVGHGDPADTIGLVDLDRALRGLSPDDRTLIALRYVAGFDSTAIAGIIGGSASGVRSRLARLLDRLRTELDR